MCVYIYIYVHIHIQNVNDSRVSVLCEDDVDVLDEAGDVDTDLAPPRAWVRIKRSKSN